VTSEKYNYLVDALKFPKFICNLLTTMSLSKEQQSKLIKKKNQ